MEENNSFLSELYANKTDENYKKLEEIKTLGDTFFRFSECEVPFVHPIKLFFGANKRQLFTFVTKTFDPCPLKA